MELIETHMPDPQPPTPEGFTVRLSPWEVEAIRAFFGGLSIGWKTYLAFDDLCKEHDLRKVHVTGPMALHLPGEPTE